MATGLLILCVGRGTKAIDGFMAQSKAYSGVLRLGEGTPSFDADSPVDQREPWEHITGVWPAARRVFVARCCWAHRLGCPHRRAVLAACGNLPAQQPLAYTGPPSLHVATCLPSSPWPRLARLRCMWQPACPAAPGLDRPARSSTVALPAAAPTSAPLSSTRADEELERAAAALTGDLQQVPPIFSAIKVDGQRLYKAARAGESAESMRLEPRAVHVDRFVVARDPSDAQSVRFEVKCSKGTYVRSLAADLGRALGSAAHLTALRRESIGEHSVSAAWQVQALVDALAVQRDAQRAEQRATSGSGGGGSGTEPVAAEPAAELEPAADA